MIREEIEIIVKKEINKLIGRINQDGLTLVPTKLYFSKGKAKIQIAVAKGKKLYDKRQVKRRGLAIEKKPRFLEIDKNDLFEYWFKLRLKIRKRIDNIKYAIQSIKNMG